MFTEILLACAQAPATSPAPISPGGSDDARIRRAFAALDPSLRREVLELATLHCEHSGTFQASLLSWVKKNQDRDRSDWPRWTQPAWYDPERCAPAQPTPRHWLDPRSAAVERAQKSLLSVRAPRGLAPGWIYDWASRSIVRQESADEVSRVFENLLAGFAPDLDLVEALVERSLDDGSFAREARAFAHAYTDRVGGAYPGITLYDAYASSAEFEMPDVDVLGLQFDLFGDFGGLAAPIPATRHVEVYTRIGEAFTPLQRQRELRTAIARTYVVGNAVLDFGYGGQLDNFHALWEDCASTPEVLAARLPSPGGRDPFLANWTKRCLEPDSPYRAGQARRATLVSDAAVTRACLVDAMTELGALPSPRKAAGAVR